jgi:hypothetical protein
MAIRKRNFTAEQKGRQTILRHPLLAHGRVTAQVYDWVKKNPGSRARDVPFLRGGSNQPLTDLAKEGLIRRVNDKKPYEYVAVPENESGARRDKVQVNLTIYVNAYGEYSCSAELIGQKITATEDFPREVALREIVVDIPHPDDPYAIRDIVDVNPRNDEPEVVYTGGQEIIDAEFVVLDNKDDS